MVTTPETTFVDYTTEGHVAVIRMNRPERLNAAGSQLRADLAVSWQRALDDDNVRVVVLTGTGRAFSAGRDIKEQVERGGTGYQPARPPVFGFYWVPDTPKPIVAAVNGGAWGAGWFMVCGSDIAVAADNALFAMSELPTGIMGPAFVPVLNVLPWLPGSELVLRGHTITATRAYELGLVNHVVPADEVMSLSMQIAQELAALPPLHVQATKSQLIMARPRPSTYQQTVAYPQAFTRLLALDDTKEAARAFTEGRKAVFRGR